jgi:PAS domain S-box-containing protein
LEDIPMAESPTYEELEKRVRALEKEKQGRKQAEKALRESEKKFRTIFESANDEIVYLDVNGTIIDVNNKILDIFGYEREEVIGKNFTEFEFVKSEEMQKTVNYFKNASHGKITSLMEFEAIRKDKTQVFIEVNTKLIEKDGDIKGFVHIIRDITDRKQTEEALRESEEKYRLLIENIPSVTWVTSEYGKTKFISPNVEKIFGYTQEEVYEGSESVWLERIHPNDVEQV